VNAKENCNGNIKRLRDINSYRGTSTQTRFYLAVVNRLETMLELEEEKGLAVGGNRLRKQFLKLK